MRAAGAGTGEAGTRAGLVLVPMRDLESCPRCGRSLMCDLRPSGAGGQVECFTVYRREHRAPDGSWCGLTMWRRGDGHH